MTKKLKWIVALSIVGVLAIILADRRQSIGAPQKSTAVSYLKNAQSGDPGLKSVGRISFGPAGLLLVAEPNSASVLAIDTGDTGPIEKLPKQIRNIDKVVAAAMGADSVQIKDIAANPKSGKVYLSVQRKPDNQSAILVIGNDGKVKNLDLSKASYARVSLPSSSEKTTVRNITDVKFAGDRVLAAGQCNEEFASKIYSIPLPFVHNSSASIFSAETFHVAHGRWETRAPIQSFVPLEDEGDPYVVGAFACTPIAKFPLENLKSGAKVKGTSIYEIGSGNRPLDMFVYESGDEQWLVCHTDRFHWDRKGGFGPSRLWGVRISLNEFLNNEKINKEATRRDIKKKAGPGKGEIVDALFGAEQVDKLNDKEIVVLRRDDQDLNLEIATLP